MKKVQVPEQLKPENELVVCCSGGKDSTAMALWFKFDSGLENKMFFVFCDTGHEHPLTVEHITRLSEKLEEPIHTIRGQRDFLELAVWKQRFPGARSRFCTSELKVVPMSEWLLDQEGNGELEAPVLCQGIRWDESFKRSKALEWDSNNKPGEKMLYECSVWRPILNWSPENVFDQHRKHDFEPNPLYKKGASRVGCWPCILAGKADIKAAFEADPDLLERLRCYEDTVARAAKRGAASFFPANKVPEVFHDRIYLKPDGSQGTYASIDAIYKWAMDPQARSLFEEHEPPTCFSQYGLCE